jgi:hypothetical protein
MKSKPHTIDNGTLTEIRNHIGRLTPRLGANEWEAALKAALLQTGEPSEVSKLIADDINSRRLKFSQGTTYADERYWLDIYAQSEASAKAELRNGARSYKELLDLKAKAEEATRLAAEAERALEAMHTEYRDLAPRIESAQVRINDLTTVKTNLDRANLEAGFAEYYKSSLDAGDAQSARAWCLRANEQATALASREIRVRIIDELIAKLTSDIERMQTRSKELEQLLK